MILIPIRDGDPRLIGLYRRHYSRRNLSPRIRLAIGPGRKLALMTPEQDAAFAFRKFQSDGVERTECTMFRNEGRRLLSDLIDEATDRARRYLEADTIYTFIDPSKVQSPNPGYCFKVAGYVATGRVTSRGLIELEHNG